MTNFQDGWTLSGTPPEFDPADDPVAFNPFGPSGAEPSFQSVTPRDLIDSARTRHWAFSGINFGDGAALLFMNQRQREHLAMAGSDVEGIVGTAIQYAVSSSIVGLLVSFVGGVPILATSGANGWVVHVDDDGVPFVDGTEPMVAADPLGAQQGFPLPSEMVRLINVMLVFGPSAQYVPCSVVNERARMNALPNRNPTAFVAGNRLIPMRTQYPNVNNTADVWQQITGIQISYVAVDTLRTLDDTVMLPVVLCGAMIADLAHFFAMQSKDVTIAERSQFRDEADRAASAFREASLNLLSSPLEGQVDYRA
jgi:hypothetical protein